MTLVLVAAGAATVLGGGLSATHAELAGGRASGMRRLTDFRGADFQPQRAAFIDWPASRAVPCDQRMQGLAAAAMADLGSAFRAADAEWLALHGYQLAVVVPESADLKGSAELTAEDGLKQVIADATVVMGLPPLGVITHACGAAGLAEAVANHIAAGRKAALLVVAADSFANERRLNTLNDAGQLFNNHNPWGLIPGEAGAALLFVPDARNAEQGALTVFGASVAHETVGEDDQQSSGYQGLTAACLSATAEVHRPIVAWDTDCNNARYRAAEFGYTALRLGQKLHQNCEIRHLSTSMGDIGAATSALALGLWWKGMDELTGPVLVTAVGQRTRRRGAIVIGQSTRQN